MHFLVPNNHKGLHVEMKDKIRLTLNIALHIISIHYARLYILLTISCA